MMRIKRMGVLLLIALLPSVGWGQDGWGDEIKVMNGSFEARTGWREVPPNTREAWIKELFPKEAVEQGIGAFSMVLKKGEGDWFEPPLLFVHAQRFEYTDQLGMSRRRGKGWELEEMLIQPDKLDAVMSEGSARAKILAPEFFKKYVLTDYHYDEELHALFQEYQLDFPKAGPCVGKSVELVGKEMTITIDIIVKEDGGAGELEEVDEIAASFRFDEGYAFTESPDKRAKKGIVKYTVLIAIPVVAALLGIEWLRRRYW